MLAVVNGFQGLLSQMIDQYYAERELTLSERKRMTKLLIACILSSTISVSPLKTQSKICLLKEDKQIIKALTTRVNPGEKVRVRRTARRLLLLYEKNFRDCNPNIPIGGTKLISK